MIELQGVHKRYGGRAVLSGVSLRIEAGSFTVLIGPSGSGKTTLLKLMNGLITPDAGHVRVHGQDLQSLTAAELTALRRRMGYVIQEAGLFPHLSVQANIAYVPRLLGWSEAHIAQRTQALMALVQLDAALCPRYPHQLSGGQRQRVGLARALAAQPGVVLMDEPLGALDDITRRALQAELRVLWQASGGAFVMVTHDIDEALSLATHLVIVHEGRIAAQGEPQALRQSPPNAVAAGLLARGQRA